MIEKNANIPDVLYALFLPFRKPDVPFLEHNVRYLPKNFRMYFLPRRCMNKPNTDLFELIKSMSAAEKGYFKKFSAKHSIGGGNAYLTLFDAIDRMSEYREDLLKKRFAKEGFVKR